MVTCNPGKGSFSDKYSFTNVVSHHAASRSGYSRAVTWRKKTINSEILSQNRLGYYYDQPPFPPLMRLESCDSECIGKNRGAGMPPTYLNSTNSPYYSRHSKLFIDFNSKDKAPNATSFLNRQVPLKIVQSYPKYECIRQSRSQASGNYSGREVNT
jgi:hypothetical protein